MLSDYRSSGDSHRQLRNRPEETRTDSFRLAHHLHLGKPVKDFLPEDAQLHFREAIPQTAVNAETE